MVFWEVMFTSLHENISNYRIYLPKKNSMAIYLYSFMCFGLDASMGKKKKKKTFNSRNLEDFPLGSLVCVQAINFALLVGT
jgi:hypothetical protein